MIGFDPQGNFLAIEDRRVVGILFTSFYCNYAFMGPVIVREQYRGRKIGENLMGAGMNQLIKRGAETIELDSVFPAAPLYRRLAFKDKYFSYRFKIISARGEGALSRFDMRLTTELIDYDKSMTGLDREKHLRRFCDEFCDSIYIIRNSHLQAYAIVRERQGGIYWVGPMVAGDYRIAKILMQGVMHKYHGHTLSLGVLEYQREFIGFLRGAGFIHTVPALRMYYGRCRDYDRNIYGIMAPEKG